MEVMGASSQGEMRGKNRMGVLEGGTKKIGSLMETPGKETTVLQSPFSTGVDFLTPWKTNGS